jgi:hypothetical protein
MDISQLHSMGLRGILYIMRGVPGCGKTYRAHQLVDQDKTRIFSADKWFSPTEDPEEYRKNWSKEKLFVAHNWCKSLLAEAMGRGVTPVVVDNTNVKRRDFMPYIDMAKHYQYMYLVEESQSPWWAEIKQLIVDPVVNAKELGKWAKKLHEGFDYNGIVIKNAHGVPEDVILRMLTSFQPYHGGEYAVKE